MNIEDAKKECLEIMVCWEQQDVMEAISELLPHVEPTFLKEWMERQMGVIATDEPK